MKRSIIEKVWIGFIAFASVMLPLATQAIVYTWTGDAADGDWTNTVNWDSNGIPVDNDGSAAGLTISINAGSIVFSGTNAPSVNVPDIGGINNNSRDTPTMSFSSGGSFLFNYVGLDGGFVTNPNTTRDVLTVGDGVGGGLEDVSVTFTNVLDLNRHVGGGIHNFVVNSDGTLIFAEDLKFSFGNDRYARITLSGGDAIVQGAIIANISNIANNYVNFNAPGGTFTAEFGGAFTDLAQVTSRLGSDFKAYGSTDKTYLTAVDNADNTFTVSMGLKWTGAAGDGDWTNTVNWLDGVIPVDTKLDDTNNVYTLGLSIHRRYTIEFDGANMPTTNFPGIGGEVGHDTPAMKLNRGGTAIFNVRGRDKGLWTNTRGFNRTLFEVGDGIGGGIEDVNLTLTNLTGSLSRHDNGNHNFKVNSDGTLTFSSNVDFSTGDLRTSIMTINGGDIIVNGFVNDMDNIAGSYVEFTATNGSFTADYGSDYVDIGKVRSRLGLDFVNNAGGKYLVAKNNGDNTFTVSLGLRWTGAAGDGDWTNTANWVDGRIPEDTYVNAGDTDANGLSLPYWDVIEFDGTNLPSVNVPGMGGDAATGRDTPTMVFNSGGTIDLDLVGREKDFWSNSGTRTVFTVGDGVTGAVENVTLNLTMQDDLSRHTTAHNTFVVNADGTFNITAGANLKFAFNGSRTSSFTIDGGTVVINKPITAFTAYAACRVDFTNVDGLFTAAFGADLINIAAVEASLNVDFIDNSGDETMQLIAVDNGDGSFTVKYGLIPPAGTLLMLQ